MADGGPVIAEQRRSSGELRRGNGGSEQRGVDREALAQRRRRIGAGLAVALLLVGAYAVWPEGSDTPAELPFEVSGTRVQRAGADQSGIHMDGLGYEVEYRPGGELIVDLTLYGHEASRIEEFHYVSPDRTDPPRLYDQIEVQVARGDATGSDDLAFEDMVPFSLDVDETVTVRTRLGFTNCEDTPVGMTLHHYPVVAVDGREPAILPMPAPVAVLGPPDERCPGRL